MILTRHSGDGHELGRNIEGGRKSRNTRLDAGDSGHELCIVRHARREGAVERARLRLLDSLQLNAKHTVATPVNWKPGEDVIIPTSVSDDEAKKKYPQGFRTLKPYLRYVGQPR
jgi:hypothetical protein